MYNANKKTLTAKRLKRLREEKGLTFVDLASELNGRYGNKDSKDEKDIISVAALKNYEISDTNHSKFNTGYGMNIKYLCIFADFYNVNTDYLLGLSNTPTTDIDDKVISEKTGLSYNSVNNLKNLKENSIDDPNAIQLVDMSGSLDDSRQILQVVNFILGDSRDGLQFLLEMGRYLFIAYETEGENDLITLFDKKTKRKRCIPVSTVKQSILSDIMQQLREWEEITCKK